MSDFVKLTYKQARILSAVLTITNTDESLPGHRQAAAICGLLDEWLGSNNEGAECVLRVSGHNSKFCEGCLQTLSEVVRDMMPGPCGDIRRVRDAFVDGDQEFDIDLS